MPLPRQQLDQLNSDLQRHEQQLADLQKGSQGNQPGIADEITFHETALKIGRDQKLIATLGEMYDTPTLIDQLASDSQTFVHSRGIQLPAGGTIMTSHRDPQSPVVGVDYYIGPYHYGFRWSVKGGFGVRRLPSSSRTFVGE